MASGASMKTASSDNLDLKAVVSRLEAKEPHVELLGPFDVRHYYGKLGDAVVPKVQISNPSVRRWSLEIS